MEVKISTENYEIINSGCVVLQMGEYLEFKIENLKFRIEFVDEPIIEGTPRDGSLSTSIVGTGTSDEHFKIKLYNQDFGFFSSIPNFLNVASISGRPLNLKFSVQPINNRNGSSDKIFFYTWYLDNEVSVQTTNNVSQQ